MGSQIAGSLCSHDSVPAMTEALSRWRADGQTDTNNPADTAALNAYVTAMEQVTTAASLFFISSLLLSLLFVRLCPSIVW